MRKLLLFLVPAGAMAQVICALGPGTSSYQPGQDQRPAGDAMQLASRVSAAEKTLCGSNCPEIALLRNPTAPNVALILDSGRARLVYSPQFFASVYSAFGDPGIVALLAHEAGHALDDAMGARWINSKWPPEIRADSWAGCLLAKSDLKPIDLHPALRAMVKSPPALQPAAWNVRVPAIRIGYTHCGGNPENFDRAASLK